MRKLKLALAPYYRQICYASNDKWDKLALYYMKNSQKILDVGCGVGRFISNDPKRILGVDGNKESINLCKNKGFDVTLGNVTKLPFKNEGFDAVNCSHLIEHLYPKEAYKLLKEIDRVLKPGGILCISAPLMNSRFYWNLTHIKPYYPQAILHYLNPGKSKQQTLEKIGNYKEIKLKYRHPQILAISDSPLWFLSPLFNFLHRLGISSLNRDGYTLILKKLN